MKVMPGIYDIGYSKLIMQSYIDIEGSGENVTSIQGDINGSYRSDCPECPEGVVNGADKTELRFITVKNTGAGSGESVAISNVQADIKLSHVTAISAAGYYAIGVFNYLSSPIMSHVTATCEGWVGPSTLCYGVLSTHSSVPVMMDVKASARYASANYGISIINGYYSGNYPLMSNVTATAEGMNENYAIYLFNFNSTSTMKNVTATAIRGTINVGVYIRDSTAFMNYVDALGDSQGNSSSTCYGVDSYNSQAHMANVTATAEGGFVNIGVGNSSNNGTQKMVNVTATAKSGTYAIGIENSGSYVDMTYVTASAYYGTGYNIGMENSGNGHWMTVKNSVLRGATASLSNLSGSNTRVSNTQLEDGPVYNNGLLYCAGIVDRNWVFFPSTCQ
ncbi:MAG: hypothetical protein ACM31N_00200 [Deltaproteobacteria bacterium]